MWLGREDYYNRGPLTQIVPRPFQRASVRTQLTLECGHRVAPRKGLLMKKYLLCLLFTSLTGCAPDIPNYDFRTRHYSIP